MASVRKREWTSPNGDRNEAWVVNYTDQGGKRRLKTFDKKRDADRFRNEVETEIEKGTHVPDRQSVSVEAACELFLRKSEDRVEAGTLGKSRIETFKAVIDKHLIPNLGSRKFNMLTWQDVEALHGAMLATGITPYSARQYLYVFKMVEDFARKRGFASKPIVHDVTKDVAGASTPKIKTFSVDQARRLIEEADKRDPNQPRRSWLMQRCAVHLAMFCGLRRGEIDGLTLEAIDIDNHVLEIRHSLTHWDDLKEPKTKAGLRQVPLPRHVADLLSEWLTSFYVDNPRRLIFRRRDGAKVVHSAYHASWKTLLERAGLRVPGEADSYHFHSLRHFAASWMIENNLPITEVASLLGHSKYDMTLQVYAHTVSGGHRRHAALQSMATTLLAVDATRMQQEIVTR